LAASSDHAAIPAAEPQASSACRPAEAAGTVEPRFFCAGWNSGPRAVFSFPSRSRAIGKHLAGRADVNSIIYLVGLIVIVLAVLSFLGLA
jgi:hypothetical protein